MEEVFALNVVSWQDALLRMLMATVLAMLLGIERDMKKKPIDFRAFGIISLASCVLAIVSQELYADFSTADHVIKMDLSKIIAGVLTGIGFLGAGAIIQQKDGLVVGTATGASIWASGALGLTIGFGYLALAFSLFLLIFTVLIGGGWVSGAIARKRD